MRFSQCRHPTARHSVGGCRQFRIGMWTGSPGSTDEAPDLRTRLLQSQRSLFIVRYSRCETIRCALRNTVLLTFPGLIVPLSFTKTRSVERNLSHERQVALGL